jgi:hypothetical protein
LQRDQLYTGGFAHPGYLSGNASSVACTFIHNDPIVSGEFQRHVGGSLWCDGDRTLKFLCLGM